MHAELESTAEVVKLARLLDVDPASLAYLEKVPPEDLRALREQATDVLFDADLGALQSMAAASRVIPVPLLAKITEGVFGPLLCARIAGLIDPPRAVDVAARLEPAFLAEVAAALDPRRATDVIAGMPVEQIVEVTRELLANDEYVTMGRFVGHLSTDALRAAVTVTDEPSLLRVAFVLEGKERLPEVLGLLPRERLRIMIEGGARDGMWPEVLDLLANVTDAYAQQPPARGAGTPDPFGTLADVAAALDPELLEGAAKAATDHELWAPLIELAARMDEAGQRRVAEVIVAARDEVLDAMFDAVAKERLWPKLLMLAAPLDRSQLEILAIRGADHIDLAALLAAAEEDERLWVPGLHLLAGLGGDVQVQLVKRASALSARQRDELAERARALGLADQLEPFAATK
jgi:hypothetical protein